MEMPYLLIVNGVMMVMKLHLMAVINVTIYVPRVVSDVFMENV